MQSVIEYFILEIITSHINFLSFSSYVRAVRNQVFRTVLNSSYKLFDIKTEFFDLITLLKGYLISVKFSNLT